MKIRIGHTVHDIQEAVGSASIRDLKYMGRESAKEGSKVTVASISAGLVKMGDMLGSGGDGSDLLSDDDVLSALQGVIYLTRRKAGEDITWDAAGIPVDGFEFVPEDGEDEAPKEGAVETADPQTSDS